ncbi:MAG: hypothetical protein D8M58_20780 [Calditrichaeota bacterium]|nr:MAG: hypothetical protein DWQ03_01110 [Calditrichota bacterium]MBL1207847.1 hypothetical protein [Calditrichota bacterium]NOG47681.1 hypothetical protein [Calditrichota bacterium]
MTLFEKVKKGLIDGFNAASDITSEYTKIGRIKIDILGVKKEIEEKMLELGGRVYDSCTSSNTLNFEKETKVLELIDQIKKLENELKKCEDDLKRINNMDETSFEQKK